MNIIISFPDPEVFDLKLTANVNKINVEWKVNDFCNATDHYIITWNEDETTTKEMNYEIVFLPACTEEIIKVSPVTSGGGAQGKAATDSTTTLAAGGTSSKFVVCIKVF